MPLKENANRDRGLYGAARAAEGSGDRQKTGVYFEKPVPPSPLTVIAASRCLDPSVRWSYPR